VREGVKCGALYDVKHCNTRHAVFSFKEKWDCVYDNGAAHTMANKLICVLMEPKYVEPRARTRSEGAAIGSGKRTCRRLWKSCTRILSDKSSSEDPSIGRVFPDDI
jgi:hypothetical protein